MAENTVENNKFWEKKYFDLFLKAPIALVGLFYVLGIFVHGFYYGRFGINSLNLFKLTYILAGFWAVLYLVLPGFIVAFLTLVLFWFLIQTLIFFFPKNIPLWIKKYFPYEKYKDVPKKNICFFILLILSIGVGIYFLSGMFLFEDNVTQTIKVIGQIPNGLIDEQPTNSFSQQLWLSIPLLLVSVIFIGLYFWTFKIIKSVLWKISISFILAVLFVSISLGLIDEFSRTSFEKIPSFLGGGKFRPVTVIIKSDDTGLVSLAGHPDKWNNHIWKMIEANKSENQESQSQKKDTEKVITLYLKLILQADEGYYFRSYGGKTILIPRDKIIHIIFQEPPTEIIEPVR